MDGGVAGDSTGRKGVLAIRMGYMFELILVMHNGKTIPLRPAQGIIPALVDPPVNAYTTRSNERV